MRLVCFLGLTAGGLVCDLLNKVESNITTDGQVESSKHDVFKGLTPYLDKGPFDESKWLGVTQNSLNPFKYYGTHTHPSNIPTEHLNQFIEVVVISSVTRKCKFYKYLRYKHLYPHYPLDIETCFSDYPPFEGCTEIKFCDIVEGKFVKDYDLNVKHFNRWKKANSYLYNQPFTEEFNYIFNNTSSG